MAATLTCPRCDSIEPATNRLCGACGHDLREPILESLDPPSEPRQWRPTAARVREAAPLIASLAALALAGTAFAITVLEPDLDACSERLWERAAAAPEPPDGWVVRNRMPMAGGWTVFIEQTAGSVDGGGGGAYVMVSCSPEPERQLAALRTWSAEDLRPDFPTLGDETVALAADESGGSQVWFRQERVIGQVQYFGSPSETDSLEAITAFIVDWVR